MSKTQSLSVDLPRIDAGTQSRLKINEDVVQDYADLIAESNGEWPFPPLDVFHDGSEHFVADGFHRFLAAHRAKRGSVPCRIHKGTAADARVFGMTANDKHGLRMSRADKKACVEWLLDNGGKMTQRAIAEAAGVSRRFVQTIVADRNPVSLAQRGHSDTPHSDAHGAPFTSVGGGSDSSDAPESPETPAKPETAPKPSKPPKGRQRAAQKAGGPDCGKCPNCAGTKWEHGDDGVSCSNCGHPFGEATGGADEDRINTQRQKTVKTVEALMRAFDDLQVMKARPEHGGSTKWPADDVEATLKDMGVIPACKGLLKLSKKWK